MKRNTGQLLFSLHTHRWVLWSSFYRWVPWGLAVKCLPKANSKLASVPRSNHLSSLSPPEPRSTSLGTWQNTELTKWRKSFLFSPTAKDHPIHSGGMMRCVWEEGSMVHRLSLKRPSDLRALSLFLFFWVLDIILELKNFLLFLCFVWKTFFQLNRDFLRTRRICYVKAALSASGLCTFPWATPLPGISHPLHGATPSHFVHEATLFSAVWPLVPCSEPFLILCFFSKIDSRHFTACIRAQEHLNIKWLRLGEMG